MKIDNQKRISYGGGKIREHSDWLKKFPQGPVRWDVWGAFDEILAENVRGDELQNFMVSKGLLILW